ncbi:MAG: prenyltransferase/squalene oxidase repeat-containing protein [Pirellulaceae bacterium]
MAEQAVKSAPPWLVSLVIHMVLLIVLGVLYLPNMFKRNIELTVIYAETEGEQLIDDTLEMASLETMDITDPVLSEDFTPVEDPFAAPPEIAELVLDATSASSDIAAPSIGLALTGREPGMKKALLGAYGGTATTEAAVKAGLEWLKKNQLQDGMWSLTGPYSSASTVENREAATAMALLAFQGAGHTHKAGEYKSVVAKGWQALLKSQDKDGNFFREGLHHHRLYTQAQCTIALCELYGMTKDEKYQKPAQLALDYCIKAQSPLGGWRYEPRQDSDTSVTGWFVMALQSARMAGLSVPSPELDRIHTFLDSVSPDGGIHYSYKPGEGTTHVMTAEALLCRQYLGWEHDDPRMIEGINYVLSIPIDYSDMNVYYWYYATQATHHMDGDYWDQWNKVMREAVPAQQTKTGPEAGSWNSADDRWGGHGGRLYTTCLSIYMLEVYYRHLPIYKYRM